MSDQIEDAFDAWADEAIPANDLPTTEQANAFRAGWGQGAAKAERERDEARAQAQALRAAIGTAEEVEAYLHDLPWTPEDADRDRTLVAGNIRTFHAWIKDRAGIGGGS